MQDSCIKVFCYFHNNGFWVERNNSEVICRTPELIHVIGDQFTAEIRWMYCCECEHYWMVERKGKEYLKSCPACGSSEKRHYYACDCCGVIMMDYTRAASRKVYSITPWGHPFPCCPGCGNVQKEIPQTHYCRSLSGMITSALAECSFCGTAHGLSNQEEHPNRSNEAMPSEQPMSVIGYGGSLKADAGRAIKRMLDIEFDENLSRVRAMLTNEETTERLSTKHLVLMK